VFLTVCVHSQADVFISRNSHLPIARVITQAIGSGACELWEQPLEPGDVIPMHYQIRNIGTKATKMLAFFPAVNPEIFPVKSK
jgi:hypothetical protein